MNAEPIATYRVQLTPAFTLHDAAQILPYLAELGVDHLYTSPYLQAVPGSLSGYDVIDPGRVNKELGGYAGHEALSHALRELGLRHMVDIVPNHMAIGGNNPWWCSVLAHGKSSPHADWFDVDWDASEALWPNRVLLPVLGDQFGRVLEAGELKLQHWEGQFSLHFHDDVFPVEPSSSAGILARVAESLQHQQLGFYAESLRRLPRPGAYMEAEVDRRHRDVSVLLYLLARVCRDEVAVVAAIEAETERLNNSPQELGELIEAQNYRLADWRAADLDLGYRRFFNINTLVGLRVELPEVCQAVHALPLQWVKEGSVHALRVDHIDGLRDPTAYLHRLREAAPASWIVIEKILQPGETLPPEWPVEGTTGYEFGQVVQGLFVDPQGEDALTRCYDEFIGGTERYEDVLLRSKRRVLKELLGSEVERLTSQLRNICERHWRYRDFTRAIIAQAIREITVGFDVYRTYVRRGAAVSAVDRGRIEAAIAAAGTANPQLDAELLQFIGRLLLLEVPGDAEEEFAMRFQQLTGPAMAKGLEDTAFYRYLRLSALNEVGGSPGIWSTSPQAFHDWCVRAQRERPYSLLATSTHDSKRGEDMRSRLVVISETSQVWREAVSRWREQLCNHQREAVDANTEYLFYQTLVGAWPVDETRMQAFMQKAAREAKLHTQWTLVDEAYEARLHCFVRDAMSNGDFMTDLEAFVASLQTSGRINALAQTLLKLTAPGVPDIYQGCETWCHHLVDPDNRREVDYRVRRKLLKELQGLSPETIMQRMDEGLPKLQVIRSALALRREHAGWFGAGSSYQPLWPEGSASDHALAFIRGGMSITVVPRLVMSMADQGDMRKGWRDTCLVLPPGRWLNRLDPGRRFEGQTSMHELLRVFPVALLAKEA